MRLFRGWRGLGLVNHHHGLTRRVTTARARPQPAYAGMARGEITRRVFTKGMRPCFPPAAPAAYAALAEACWASDPRERPRLAGPGGVVAQLEAMMAALEAGAR